MGEVPIVSKEADQPGLFGDASGVEPATLSPRDAALAAMLPDGLRLGTSSWSFPGWTGTVWRHSEGESLTESRLARQGLPAYATHPLLRTVGLDRSYYTPLSESECRSYASQVPEDFRFVMKADRALVFPDLGLLTGKRAGPNPRLMDAAYAADAVIGPAVAGFGLRLGAIVFQFPPMGRVCIGGLGGPRGFADRLHDFLSSLPIGPEYAVEVRDASLLGCAYRDAIMQSGTSHCYAVHPSAAALEAQVECMDPGEQRVCIVRWMLNPWTGDTYRSAKDRYEPFDRLVDADDRSLEGIASILRRASTLDRLVVINNKAEGSAPLSAQRLAERMVGRGGE